MAAWVVGIDEARQNEHVFQIELLFGFPGGGQLVARSHGGHAPLINGQGRIFQNTSPGVLGHDQRGVKKRLAVLHANLTEFG